MAQKQHYVSQFHLRQFLDPESVSTPDPWVWIGDIRTGVVKRRAPKNFASSPGMFDGPGGFADDRITIERHLAREVEPAAAKALWSFLRQPVGTRGEIPAALSRYISWAASRSLTWTALVQEWEGSFDPSEEYQAVEPPPPGIGTAEGRPRLHRLEHEELGTREGVRTEELDELRKAGWKWKLSRDDLLEMIHMQAYYFQARFFPRLHWTALWAPKGSYFIMGDRPVIWGVDGFLDIPPSALRDPRVQLIVPLSHSVALLAEHADREPRAGIAISNFNCWMTFAAREWIISADERTVAESLSTVKNTP